MAVSPYTSQFQNARADLENRIDDGRIKDRNDIEEFLRSRQLTLEDFEKAEEEYQEDLKTGKASNLPGTVVRLPGITETDKKDILFGVKQKVNFT